MVSHEVPFDLYLCIVKITQYWSVDCTERDFVGQTIMAEHLVSPSGKKAENLPLDEMMIMPECALHSLLDNDPDDKRLKEATGNDGVTQNRWYRWAAVLFGQSTQCQMCQSLPQRDLV